MITECGTRSGYVAAHSSARCPPIDPPTTDAHFSMPSSSASSASTAIWSRIVIVGNFDPYGRPDSGSTDAGPVVPWHPPSTFGATTKNWFVSIARPGPISASQ